MNDRSEEGHDVAFFYEGTPWELHLRGVIHNPEMLFPFSDFLEFAKNGSLPSFSFINPLAGIEPNTNRGCNDYHPDHSVALGEAFLKQIYGLIREEEFFFIIIIYYYYFLILFF